jgi:hypothetical protein
MAQDHRIIGPNGQRLPFTCQNHRYRTNINKGEAHSPMSQNRGSVFPAPLVNHDGWSLWLEHVEEIGNAAEVYWLMWYGPDGRPTIPLSGVFDRAELSSLVGQLASFVP